MIRSAGNCHENSIWYLLLTTSFQSPLLWSNLMTSCPSLRLWELSGLIFIVKPRRLIRRKDSWVLDDEFQPWNGLLALCRLSVPAEWLCLYLFHASLCACWLPWCTALSQCFHLKGGCVFPQKTQLVSVSTVWNPGQKEMGSFSHFLFGFQSVLVLCFWHVCFHSYWKLYLTAVWGTRQLDPILANFCSISLLTLKICHNEGHNTN